MQFDFHLRSMSSLISTLEFLLSSIYCSFIYLLCLEVFWLKWWLEFIFLDKACYLKPGTVFLWGFCDVTGTSSSERHTASKPSVGFILGCKPFGCVGSFNIKVLEKQVKEL